MDSHQRAVVNRLKTARGHINGIISIVEDDAYCPDVMKQLSAVQGLLEGASRVMLRRHLESCVAKAMQEGRTTEIVDELMDTLKFDKQVFATPPPAVSDALLATQSPPTKPPGQQSPGLSPSAGSTTTGSTGAEPAASAGEESA